jgi:hypothetical protein
LEEKAMKAKDVLSKGARIVAVCALFGLCLIVGTMLSGMDRVGRQPMPSSSASAGLAVGQQPASIPTPQSLLVPLLIYCVCVGSVVSLLILRSRWHGWTLTGAMFAGIYGISCVVNAIEGAAFLSEKTPPGMMFTWLLQGAISTALFAPLAVLVLGGWRSQALAIGPPAWPKPSSALWRVGVIILAFVFFYMFFGYYVAWQNPAVRQYYGGPEYSTFYAALKGNWVHVRWIYSLAAFRGLLFVVFLYPLVRMFRGKRWQIAVAMSLFVVAWTTALLLPNPLMLPEVAHTHFIETLGFGLVMGALIGDLLAIPPTSGENIGSSSGSTTSFSGGIFRKFCESNGMERKEQ